MEIEEFASEINVTPLVDVMLVLLVIFMVTAPMMTEGFDIRLPEVDTSEILSTEKDHIVLSVKADGAIYINDHETVIEELPIALATYKKNDTPLFVKADKEARYGLVMQTMDTVRISGIKKVSLITTSADGNNTQKQ